MKKSSRLSNSNTVAGEFQKALGLAAFQRWHGFEKLVQRKTGGQVINEHLDRNTGSPEAGRSRQSIRIDPNDLVEASKECRAHRFSVQQAPDWIQRCASPAG